jgi:hypothetical protein
VSKSKDEDGRLKGENLPLIVLPTSSLSSIKIRGYRDDR